ncbi:MAG: nucleotidyltransferase domain-containing protein [Dehalococcoidia bacterium]
MAREITPATIEHVVRTIVERFDPERIILFGSRARGDHRPDSDLDLFIELEVDPAVPPRERARRIRSVFHPYPCAMDLIVYTPAESAYWRQAAASLPSMVYREGKVLYERARPGVGAGVVRESGA